MSKIEKRATWAEKPENKELLGELFTEIRNDLFTAFLNSEPENPGTREELHATGRALTKIEDRLKNWEFEPQFNKDQ